MSNNSLQRKKKRIIIPVNSLNYDSLYVFFIISLVKVLCIKKNKNMLTQYKDSLQLFTWTILSSIYTYTNTHTNNKQIE